MWLVFAIFAILWVVSVNFYLPAWVTIGLFAAAITTVLVALLSPRERAVTDAGDFRWYRVRD